MAVLAYWPLAFFFLSLVITNSERGKVLGLESKSTDSDTTEVKCRQHIEDALSKYWENDKGHPKVPPPGLKDEDNSGEDQPEDDDSDEVSDEDSEQQDEGKTSLEDSDESDEDTKEKCDEPSVENKDSDENDSDEDHSKSAESDEPMVQKKDSKEEDTSADDVSGESGESRESDEDGDSKEDSTPDSASQSVEDSKEYSKEDSKEDSKEESKEDSKEDSKESDEVIVPVKKEQTVQNPKAIKREPEPEPEPESDESVESDKNDSDEEEDMGALRSRSQVEDILRLYEIGTKEENAEQHLILSIFRDLKKIYEKDIKPLEKLYKYRDITTRLISDSEIFSKPLVMFLGAKSSGKTSLVNYLLGLESTPWQLRTGLTATPHFTVLTHGDSYSKLGPTELAADFAFSNLQQFGQHFFDHHMHAHRMPLSILQKLTIVDSPGLIDGAFVKSPEPGKGVDSEVYQWFIDRSDVIYIVLDVSQVHVSQSLQSLLEQLKGRDVRFIINKADVIPSSQMIMLMGQLLWMLSPIMPSDQPPQVYAITSASTAEYDAFIDSQEQQWLTDLAEQVSGLHRIESRVAAVRRHAVRVRNHAKLIDCYLATYYQHKGMFSFGANRVLANKITENPHEYRIFSGAVTGQSHNISRYDLPDPAIYREFFRVNSLDDFKPLSATCSFFKGCPIDKLDVAIAYQLPDLIGKYKKLTKATKSKK